MDSSKEGWQRGKGSGKRKGTRHRSEIFRREGGKSGGIGNADGPCVGTLRASGRGQEMLAPALSSLDIPALLGVPVLSIKFDH